MRCAVVFLLLTGIFALINDTGGAHTTEDSTSTSTTEKPKTEKPKKPKLITSLLGQSAKKQIGESSQDMLSAQLLHKKALDVKKMASKEHGQVKKEKMKVFKRLEKLALLKKNAAIEKAKKAIEKSPLEALQHLRKMKNSKSGLKSKTAKIIATKIIHHQREENRKLPPKRETLRMLTKIARD